MWTTEMFWELDGMNSPHIQSLSKEKVVVEVSDGAIHCIAVSHFHHGCPRLTLHELHLWNVTAKNKNKKKTIDQCP